LNIVHSLGNRLIPKNYSLQTLVILVMARIWAR
jgi:hypothetical protein